jgi:hypothetical protein
MAPPLLPTTRLTTCPACAEHVKLSESTCPHCGAELPRRGGVVAAVAVGLAMSGCPGKDDPTTTSTVSEADYGVAATTLSDTSETGTETGTGTDPSTTAGEAEYGVATTADETTESPTTTAGEAEYGVPQTGTDTDTDTDTSTGGETTATATSNGEADYGVAAT